MNGGASDIPTEIQQVMHDAHRLGARLQRVAVALTVTEDAIADTLQKLAGQGGAHATERQLLAKRARETAEICRSFAIELLEQADTARVLSGPPEQRT